MGKMQHTEHRQEINNIQKNRKKIKIKKIFFSQYAETLTFKTLSVRVLLNPGCDVNYLGQTACCMEDFLPVSWVSDPNVSEILVLHHVTSLRVEKFFRDTSKQTMCRHTNHSHTHACVILMLCSDIL